MLRESIIEKMFCNQRDRNELRTAQIAKGSMCMVKNIESHGRPRESMMSGDGYVKKSQKIRKGKTQEATRQKEAGRKSL